jgi:hypothetical protein
MFSFDNERKQKTPKYAHKHEVIIAENSEYQARNFLAEIPQITWMVEKTYGGKNKYILQSDSKAHIDFFLHMLNNYIIKKSQFTTTMLTNMGGSNSLNDIKTKQIKNDDCESSLEHIRFKHIDGTWYG